MSIKSVRDDIPVPTESRHGGCRVASVSDREDERGPTAPKAQPAVYGRVDELDGLRGVLALWVAISHILLWCGFAEPPLSGGRFGRMWDSMIYSPFAVEAFFILSGFAISSLIYARPQSYLGFMTGRFFRIYPVYLLCLFLSLVLMGVTPWLLENASWRQTAYFSAVGSLSASERAHPVLHGVSHLSLLNGMVPRQVLPGSAATLLPPAWSISVEWQYYLVAPMIALFVRSAGGLLLLVGGAWLAIRYGGPWHNPLPAFFPVMLPFFLVGIGSHYLYKAFCASGGKRSSRYTALVAAALGVALLSGWEPVTMAIWAAAFGCLFVDGNGLMTRILCWVRRSLRNRWIQWLGRISYPLYLVHWPLIIVGLTLLVWWRPTMHFREAVLWMLGAGLPLILLAGFLLHKYVEAPAMRLGRQLSETVSKGSLMEILRGMKPRRLVAAPSAAAPQALRPDAPIEQQPPPMQRL